MCSAMSSRDIIESRTQSNVKGAGPDVKPLDQTDRHLHLCWDACMPHKEASNKNIFYTHNPCACLA